MSVQTTYDTTQPIAYEGQLADDGAHDVLPLFNEESSAPIAFGLAVKRGTAANGAKLPSSQSDVIDGIVLHAHNYTKGHTGADLTDDGLIPGAVMNVLRKGRCVVRTPTGCAVNERGYVRRTAGEGETLGSIENAADSTDMVDCRGQIVFRTAAGPGELAVIEVDFTNKP